MSFGGSDVNGKQSGYIYGFKRDFDLYLENEISDTEDITRFMEVIQNYNFRLRPSNTAQG